MPASDRKTGSLGASVIVGGSAALSRILGFVREILIAALFGTGGVADALLVGLRLPNLLRRTLGEGGAQGALVPWLMHEKATRPPDDARRASGSLLVGLAIAAALLCIATILLRAPLTLLLAPGFTKAQSGFSLAAECLALSFPIVGASLLTAFATAWLALERAYVLASLTGLLVNMVLIAVLGWVQHFQVQEDSAARWIAGSMALAGLGQAAVLLWVILRQAAAPCLAVPDWRALAVVGKRLLPSLTVAAAPQLAFLIVLIPATQCCLPSRSPWFCFSAALFLSPMRPIRPKPCKCWLWPCPLWSAGGCSGRLFLRSNFITHRLWQACADCWRLCLHRHWPATEPSWAWPMRVP